MRWNAIGFDVSTDISLLQITTARAVADLGRVQPRAIGAGRCGVESFLAVLLLIGVP